ncbi:MAG: CHAT domain-containing protein [Nannocystis sp.]|nr:CHAT domain-containing protein [Nannocystis sp.]
MNASLPRPTTRAIARAWDAAVIAGEALERLGDDDAALIRYRRAAELHARRLAAVSEGREVFAADGDRGARRLVALLVRLGRLDEALCAARRARTRPFAAAAASVRDPDALRDYHRERRALDAELERAWELPGAARAQRRVELRAGLAQLERRLDELLLGKLPADSAGAEREVCAQPAPGVVMLVFYPSELGYLAFAQDVSGVVAVELVGELPTDPGERAARLLDPFAAKLEEATRIEVLASGPLTREAFHALPWRARALIERAPVAYRLDLPRPVVASAPRSVLQLVPESNLPGGSAEVLAAARVLRERGLSLIERRGDEDDLRQQLRVDLLHYVGHAHAEGWDSALELGGDRRLSARDLLAGPAPTLAVLGGCETGLPDPRAHGGGISLAHALLLA